MTVATYTPRTRRHAHDRLEFHGDWNYTLRDQAGQPADRGATHPGSPD